MKYQLIQNRLLEDGGTPLLGYVFNDVPVHRGGYGYYGYGRYGYGYYGYGRYAYGEESQKPES